jgi:hypothetical protein
VYPISSPPAGPVLIKGKGFTADTKVYFGKVQAKIEANNENYLSTIVPNGLLGKVELSVENGKGCLQSKNFEVASATPSNLPVSPPVYIIPPAGFAFPVQVGQNQTLTLTNFWDAKHRIRFLSFNMQKKLISGEEEIDEASYPLNGTHDPNLNKVVITIDRSGSNLPNEKLEGGFYTLTLKSGTREVMGNFLVTFSTITGRQYIFY